MFKIIKLNTLLSALLATSLSTSLFANPAASFDNSALRHNRHALIISISKYGDPAVPPLPGASIDKKSATEIAHTMQVPDSNIMYLQDDQATGDNIRKALQDLNDKTQEGDRVFVHFSGHGTRFKDPNAGGCIEALLAYDGGTSGTITNTEMAQLLKPITSKTDKLMVMYDACHSGGLINTGAKNNTRSLANATTQGKLRPKFANISGECSIPTNIRTRSLAGEAQKSGTLPQDIIHISASKDNEISFDDEIKGGLATQFIRDCMLREAVDQDQSGAISINEIKICAQNKINTRMLHDANFKAHNLVLSGNSTFVPAWFSQTSAMALTMATSLSTLVQEVTGEQALRQIYDQRDAKRTVQAVVNKSKLKINSDYLDFTVQSSRSGYVYIAFAGTDNKSLHLLFPNDIDQNNKIEANKLFFLPRPEWKVKAGGPVGTNHLLIMVTDGPRDINSLVNTKDGPFVKSLNDSQGRAKLGALLTVSQNGAEELCKDQADRAKNPACSDAFGATMFKIEEIE